jgi:cell wall-associated NlpC family hydrolase
MPATADPRPTLAQVEKRVAALEEEAEHAAERYNDIRVEIAEVERGLARARGNVARSQKQVDAMRTLMGRLARNSYQSGGMDPTLELLLSGNPATVLDRAATIEQLAKTEQTALRKSSPRRTPSTRTWLSSTTSSPRCATCRPRCRGEATYRRVRRRRTATACRPARGGRERLAAVERRRRRPRSRRPGRPRASWRSPNVGPASGRASVAVRTALAQVGDSYVYGADGPSSFDCSGLTMLRLARGRRVVRLARPERSSRPDARSASPTCSPGDLVYYYSPISHVGIYIGGGKIDAMPPTRGTTCGVDGLDSMPYVGATRP